jgi:hypothetical protein
MRVVGYKDDCDADQIVASDWCSEGTKLALYLSKVDPSGGGDRPEAIDTALRAAIQEMRCQSVILLGDAPPHSDRPGLVEAAQLAQARRPVYAIPIGNAPDTTAAFQQIAETSGGRLIKVDDLTELCDVLQVVVAKGCGEKTLRLLMSKFGTSLNAAAHNTAKLLR